MNKKVIPPDPSGVQEIALREALEERYLDIIAAGEISRLTGRVAASDRHV